MRFLYISALAATALVVVNPASAAVFYTYTGDKPNISFQFSSQSFITDTSKRSSADVSAVGNDEFEYVRFCASGKACGADGGYNFTAEGDELYFVNVRPRGDDISGTTTVTLPDGSVVTFPKATVAVDVKFDVGAFGKLGTYKSSTGLATLTVSNSALPEPSTWMMLVLGFGVIGYALRRKTVLRYV